MMGLSANRATVPSSVAARSGKGRLVMLVRGRAEAAEDDPLDRGRLAECRDDGADGDERRPLGRKAVSAGRDGGIGDRGEAVLGDKREAVAIAACEQPAFAALAAAPDGADRVNHMPRLEAEAGRDLGLARRATAERGASRFKLGAGRAVDRAVDAATAEQTPIGGVDDGIDIERGDVALDDFDAVMHSRIGRRVQAPIKSGLAGYWDADAAGPSAEDGLTDLIQAMIFHTSSLDLTTPPMGGIGPTTFSDPLR